MRRGIYVSAPGQCPYLDKSREGYYCKVRNMSIIDTEVRYKCTNPKLYQYCAIAYEDLIKANKLASERSPEALLWLKEATEYFKIIGETDNAIYSEIQAIKIALALEMDDEAKRRYKIAREIYDEGIARGDPALSNPRILDQLNEIGSKVTESFKVSEPMMALQAELKQSLMQGIKLKPAEKRDKIDMQLEVIDRQQVYRQKSAEYWEAAEKYLQSGIIQSAVLFACLGSLSDLMLGNAKDAIKKLVNFVDRTGKKDEISDLSIFKMTKLLFKAYVEKSHVALSDAEVLFRKMVFVFDDDEQFAKRAVQFVKNAIKS